jgi:hypothetical protein
MTRASSPGRLRSDLGIFERAWVSVVVASHGYEIQEAAGVHMRQSGRPDSAGLIVKELHP